MTLEQFAAANPSADPAETIRNYRNQQQLELLKSGEYDDLAPELDTVLQEYAATNGIEVNFNQRNDRKDLEYVSQYSQDPAAQAAARTYLAVDDPKIKDTYGDPVKYDEVLSSARAAVEQTVNPIERNKARRAALDSGDTPFAVFQDPTTGEERLDVSPALKDLAGNDEALAAYFEANPDLDVSRIPEIRQKLKTPDGFTVPAFQIDRQHDWMGAFTKVLSEDRNIARKVSDLRAAADKGTPVNEALLDQIDTELGAYGMHGDTSPEAAAERKAYIKDFINMSAAPEVDEENLDNNIRTLSTGQKVLPMAVMLQRPLFDKVVASPSIPESQRTMLKENRDAQISAMAPEMFKTIAANRPLEFPAFMQERKDKGMSNAAILDEWMANPDNYSQARSFLGGAGESVLEGFGGLVMYPAAMLGNESARKALTDLQKSDMDRRNYAQMFGKNLGVGYDLTRLVAPVAADVSVSLLTGGAATAAVTSKNIVKSGIKAALKGAVEAGAYKAFTRGAATQSVDQIIDSAGKNLANKFVKTATTASYLGTAFNRSAGSTYVQLYSQLSEEKNPDGSAKYTPEKAREIALNHGLIAGTLTAAITGGFSFLGAGGIESIYGNVSRKQLGRIFDKVKQDFDQLAPSVRAGLDMTNVDSFITSVAKKAVRPMLSEVGKGFKDEALEEGLDQFAGYFNQQIATGDQINIADAFKQAGYAAMLGGVMGGTVVGINEAASGAPDVNTEALARRTALYDIAAKLDAASSPRTAEAIRRFAVEGFPTAPTPGGTGGTEAPAAAKESVPAGAAPAGGEQTPSGPAVAGEAAPVEVAAAPVDPVTGRPVVTSPTFTESDVARRMRQPTTAEETPAPSGRPVVTRPGFTESDVARRMRQQAPVEPLTPEQEEQAVASSMPGQKVRIGAPKEVKQRVVRKAASLTKETQAVGFRDTTKPEQMNPVEFKALSDEFDRIANMPNGGSGMTATEESLLNKWWDLMRMGVPTKGDTILDSDWAGAIRRAGVELDSPFANYLLSVASATETRQPVSAEAVDIYGIKIPEGYTKQGELYVYEPNQEAETPAPSVQVSPVPTGQTVTPSAVPAGSGAQAAATPKAQAKGKVKLSDGAAQTIIATRQIGNFSGKGNADIRAAIMSELTGKKVAKSKAGYNAFVDTLAANYGITKDDKTIAAYEKAIVEAVTAEAQAPVSGPDAFGVTPEWDAAATLAGVEYDELFKTELEKSKKGDKEAASLVWRMRNEPAYGRAAYQQRRADEMVQQGPTPAPEPEQGLTEIPNVEAALYEHPESSNATEEEAQLIADALNPELSASPELAMDEAVADGKDPWGAARRLISDIAPDVDVDMLSEQAILDMVGGHPTVQAKLKLDTMTQQSIRAVDRQLQGAAPPKKAFTEANSPVTKEIIQYGGLENITRFLQNVVTKAPKHQKDVAKLILEFGDMLGTVPITQVHLPNFPFSGAYIPETGQILINTAVPGPRGAVDTVLHELLHAATTHSIANPTPAQQKVLVRLERIRQSVKKRAENNGMKHLAYGLSSLDEMLTHFFTSPTFQSDVSALTPKGERNWVQVIIEAIKDLLNGKVRTQQDKVSQEIMSDLIEFTRDAAYERYGPHAKTTDGRVLLLPAYHGTPHKVDRFSMSKIGTGEGAQAYGWGLYFAQDESVAKYYRDELSKGKKTNHRQVNELIRELVSQNAFNEKGLTDHIAFLENEQEQTGDYASELAIAKQLKRMLDAGDINYGPAGNLYQVELLVDDDQLLDWDLPLSEQSEKVKSVLGSFSPIRAMLGGMRGKPWADVSVQPYFKGRDLYEEVQQDMDPEAASKALLAAGIKGIRFLDGSSRSKGEGNYNYVIFDENDIQITAENGVPVTAAQATAPEPGPYGPTPRMDALMRLPEGDVRNTARFIELTSGVTPENVEQWRAENPEAYQELREMREEVLRGAGWDVGPVYHGTNANFTVFRKGKGGRSLDRDTKGVIFFSSSTEVADYFTWGKAVGQKRETGKVMSVLLRTDNPLEMNMMGAWKNPDQVSEWIKWAKEDKNDSLILKNVMDAPVGVGSDVIVVFDPNQIKSTEPINFDSDNQLILPHRWADAGSPDIRFQLPEGDGDAEYLAAVERGDMETAQQMVDEAARAAGYDISAVHGSSSEKAFTVFDTETSAYGRVQGSYFTQNLKGTWSGWLKSRRPMRVFLRFNNPATKDVLSEMGYRLTGTEAKKWLSLRGYDGVIDTSMDEVVAFTPNQIKSADPVTYDDQGNVIPLSQRFNTGSPDIRFQIPEAPHSPDLVRAIAAGFTPDDVDLDINFDALIEGTKGLNPVNREHLIAATVNRALSLKAGFDALGDDVTTDERERLTRMHEMIMSGYTLDSDIGFYRSNPTAMQKLVRFLTAAVKAAYARLKLRFDNRTAVFIDRMTRELSRAKEGYRTRSTRKRFDPADPDANRQDALMQLPENSAARRRSSLRVKLTREALTDLALSQESWRDWYSQHQDVLDEFFGEDAQLFQDILAATSQATEVKSNVSLALRAYSQFKRGEAFTDFLPAVIGNLEKLRNNLDLGGQKISTYKRANDGEAGAVVVDRHIARLLFGVVSPSKAQFDKAAKILTEIADKLGWTPQQVQASLWAASIVKSGKTPQSYAQYLKRLEDEGKLTTAKRLGTVGLRGRTGDGVSGGRGRYIVGSPEDGIRDAEGILESESPDIRFQLPEPGTEYTAWTEVDVGNKLFDSDPNQQPRGYFGRMFKQSYDVRDATAAVLKSRDALRRGTQKAINVLSAKYQQALKEGADPDLLRVAIGSNKPMLTLEDELAIEAEFNIRNEAASNIAAPRIQQAQKDRAAARRRATTDEERDAVEEAYDLAVQNAKALQNKAFNEVAEWERTAMRDRALANAERLREQSSIAMEKLKEQSPIGYEWAFEMRKTLDEIITKNAKEYANDRPELAWVMDNSQGVYLVRTFNFHRDPTMADKLLHSTDPAFVELQEVGINFFGKHLADLKIEELRENPAYADYDELSLRAQALTEVREEAKKLFEDYVMGQEGASAPAGSGLHDIRTEFQRFMRKKDLPDEILEILGEIDDPLFNSMRTFSSVTGILFNQRMLKAVRKDGLKNGWLIDEATKTADKKYSTWVPFVAANEKSESYAPLAGLYAAPKDVEALKAALNVGGRMSLDTAGKTYAAANRALIGAAGLSMGVMTLGSVGYFSRNMVGGVLLALSQGTNPVSKLGWESMKTAYTASFGKNTDADVQELIARRVLGDGVNITYLKEFLQKYREDPINILQWAEDKGFKLNEQALDKLKGAGGSWTKMTDFLSKAAEFTETFQNPLIYFSEFDALMESGLYEGNEEGAKQEAARRTKMVTPGKSENPQAVTQFSKNPLSALVAPFIRFKAEMMRTTWNTYLLAYQDITSGNATMRDHGINRMQSAIVVHGALTIGLPLFMQWVLGISDDEDEAIRKGMPSYSRNSTFVYFKNKETGAITTWDLSFANPFSFVFDPFTQVIKAGGREDYSEIPAIATRFVTSDLMGEQIVAGKALDVSRNIDESTGLPIYMDVDNMVERFTKSAMHILEGSYTPQVLRKSAQAIQATYRPDTDEEPFFYTPLGILVGHVAPVRPRSHKPEDLAYRAFRNLQKSNAELWQITGPMSSPAPMDPEDVTGIYEKRKRAGLKVWQEMYRTGKAFQEMGLTQHQVARQATDAGLSKKRVGLAMNGFMERPVIAADKAKDIREIDERRLDVYREAVRKTPQFIRLD